MVFMTSSIKRAKTQPAERPSYKKKTLQGKVESYEEPPTSSLSHHYQFDYVHHACSETPSSNGSSMYAVRY